MSRQQAVSAAAFQAIGVPVELMLSSPTMKKILEILFFEGCIQVIETKQSDQVVERLADANNEERVEVLNPYAVSPA